MTLTQFSRSPHYKDCKNEPCLQSVSWSSWWILTKLAQKHHWDKGKKWLDFGDLDFIFQVTPALWMSNVDQKKACLHPISWTKWWILAKLYVLYHWDNQKNWLDFDDLDLIFSTLKFQSLTKKILSAPYRLNQMTDSGQTSYIVMLGWVKDLIRFWWPWPNFQGHHIIKTVKMSFVCTLSPEPIGGLGDIVFLRKLVFLRKHSFHFFFWKLLLPAKSSHCQERTRAKWVWQHD